MTGSLLAVPMANSGYLADGEDLSDIDTASSSRTVQSSPEYSLEQTLTPRRQNSTNDDDDDTPVVRNGRMVKDTSENSFLEAYNEANANMQLLSTKESRLALTVDRLQDLHESLVGRPSENEKAEDPRGLKVPLMPHQQHALAWLLWREGQRPSGGILADDMGLGKTLTMIALVKHDKENSNGIMEHDYNDDDDNNNDPRLTDSTSDSRLREDNPSDNKGGTLVVCPTSIFAIKSCFVLHNKI